LVISKDKGSSFLNFLRIAKLSLFRHSMSTNARVVNLVQLSQVLSHWASECPLFYNTWLWKSHSHAVHES